MTPAERADASSQLIHALDLPKVKRLLVALDDVRPIATAPSIGESVRALRSATTRRTIRKALAELDALVNRAAHGRTKRGERANLVAQLALLCELHQPLGLDPDADVRSARRRIEELLA